MSGWIKLNRSLSNHDLWNEKPFSRGQAWVDLIVLANHKDGFIRIAGQKITIKRGQCGWSQLRLSERWGWSRGKVKRFFSDLKNEHMIDTETNTRNTIITICNYSKFQESNDRDGTTDSTTDDTTDEHQIEQQTDTNKNDKKEKKDKEVLTATPFTPKKIGLNFDLWSSKPSDQVLRDYKKNRKAALTQTAVDRMASEINKANDNGMTADECLSVCCEAGWQGFKYDWYLNREKTNGTNRQNSTASKHQNFLDNLKAL